MAERRRAAAAWVAEARAPGYEVYFRCSTRFSPSAILVLPWDQQRYDSIRISLEDCGDLLLDIQREMRICFSRPSLRSKKISSANPAQGDHQCVGFQP